MFDPANNSLGKRVLTFREHETINRAMQSVWTMPKTLIEQPGPSTKDEFMEIRMLPRKHPDGVVAERVGLFGRAIALHDYLYPIKEVMVNPRRYFLFAPEWGIMLAPYTFVLPDRDFAGVIQKPATFYWQDPDHDACWIGAPLKDAPRPHIHFYAENGETKFTTDLMMMKMMYED